MPAHCDPDDLALMALGEPPPTPADDAHLAGCSACQSELDQLRAVVATGRSVQQADVPEAPSDEVWQRVSTELGLGAGAGSAPDSTDVTAADAGSGATVTPLATRRRPPGWGAVVGIAAAAAAIGVLATLGVGALTRGGDPPVLSETQLAALQGHQGSGIAEVEGHGSDRVLDLHVNGLTKGDGFYEVWLLDKDGKKLVSLGLLRGDHSRFTLPAGVDLRDYPVVDISIEPADGNPAHSGDSVVRGTLPS